MKSIGIMLLTILFSLNTFSQNQNFHIYLCFGQSNMEGSAKIEEQDKTGDKRFKILQAIDCANLNRKQAEWYTAEPPLCNCHQGLSLADYFGRTMVANLPDSVTVGIVHVAVGGSDIRLFDKDIYEKYTDTYPEKWFQDKIKNYGGNPYKRLIELAKLAQKTGVIKGFLLHQGETNTGDTKWPEYVKKIYASMLNDLSLEAEKIPLLAGEVVHEEQGGICAQMNPIINKLPRTIPTAHVISSRGCSVRSDSVHFDASGVRELGWRYAAKMLLLQGQKTETKRWGELKCD